MFNRSHSSAQARPNTGVETTEVITSASHPNAENLLVVYEIEQKAKKGWQLVGRKTSEGIFGITAHTTPRFARPRSINGVPINKIKFEVKTINVGLLSPWHDFCIS